MEVQVVSLFDALSKNEGTIERLDLSLAGVEWPLGTPVKYATPAEL